MERAASRVREAAERGADLVALPENFAFMGSDEERARMEQDLDGEVMGTLRGLARRYGVNLMAGGFLERSPDPADSRPYNTAVFLDREGRTAALYRKVHLFDVSLSDGASYCESDHIRAGDELVTLEHEGVTFGFSICYDLRFPQLYRALARRGAQVVFVPAAFTLVTGKDHWLPLLQARAIENQFYVVAPAQFGRHDRRRSTYGHSAIVDPWGTIVAQGSEKECIIEAEFDPGFLEEVRRKIPVLDHERPDLYAEEP